MLELSALTGGYDGVPLLKNIDLTLEDGTVGVVGPNGCGKSTLLRLVAGLLCPFSGSVLLDGVDTRALTRLAFARRVSYLPQARSVPSMSVSSLVLHGRHPYLSYPRRFRAEDRRAAEEAMALTGAIEYRDRNMQSLSGGERQKAYLAMCVAQDTDVMLLDEPTTYLDIRHQFEIMELSKKLKARGKLVVMVLHDLNLAIRYCDKIAVMEAGKVLAYTSPEELLKTELLSKVFHVRTALVRANGIQQLLFEPKEEA